MDARLLNVGFTATYIGIGGESVVDLSWSTTAALPLIKKWEIKKEAVMCSDHRRIELIIGSRISGAEVAARKNKHFPSWSVRKVDMDIFRARLVFGTWTEVVNR